MTYQQRHLLYIFLGVSAIAGGFTMSGDPRAAAQSALETDRKGWRDITPNARLEGWTRLPVPSSAALGPAQWRVDPQTGYLICEGSGGHDWLRFDRELTDFILHVEWRYTPVEGKTGHNSGIYVRNSPDGKVWHQAQLGAGAGGGYLFGETLVGAELKRFNFSPQLKEQRVKPVGEWNTYEVTCQGRTVTVWVNGAVTNRWTDCQVPRGFLGLEGEGHRIEFRNLKLKELEARTRSDPALARTLRIQARNLARGARGREAIALLSRAILHDPENAVLHRERGHLYRAVLRDEARAREDEARAAGLQAP